jgi:hypothetical protein
MVIKALINGVYKSSIWEKLYILLDKTFIKVKQVMDNLVSIDKMSVVR